MISHADKERLDEAIQSYELALQLIEQYGGLISGEECSQIAFRGESGDLNWLLSWEAPE